MKSPIKGEAPKKGKTGKKVGFDPQQAQLHGNWKTGERKRDGVRESGKKEKISKKALDEARKSDRILNLLTDGNLIDYE